MKTIDRIIRWKKHDKLIDYFFMKIESHDCVYMRANQSNYWWAVIFFPKLTYLQSCFIHLFFFLSTLLFRKLWGLKAILFNPLIEMQSYQIVCFLKILICEALREYEMLSVATWPNPNRKSNYSS